MKSLSTLLAGALLSATVCAQGVITRIGNDGTQFYYNGIADLQLAFNDAADNGLGVDTILFSGGAFTLAQDLMITSPVIAIGSGFRADSADAYLQPTEFIGFNRYVTIMPDASGSEFHGLTISTGNGVRLGDSYVNSDVNGILFMRSAIGELTVTGAGSNPRLADGMHVEHCVIGTMDLDGALDPFIRNSFLGNVYNAGLGSNALFQNCLFLDWHEQGNSDGATYANSIFLRDWNATLNVGVPSIYSHCLFIGNGNSFTVTFGAGVTSTSAYVRQSLIGVLPSLTTPADYLTYDATADYHVADGALLGTDGNEVGIYGGDAQWKDGSLPFNPHWSQLASPGSTVNGVLTPVTIKASAQSN